MTKDNPIEIETKNSFKESFTLGNTVVLISIIGAMYLLFVFIMKLGRQYYFSYSGFGYIKLTNTIDSFVMGVLMIVVATGVILALLLLLLVNCTYKCNKIVRKKSWEAGIAGISLIAISIGGFFLASYILKTNPASNYILAMILAMSSYFSYALVRGKIKENKDCAFLLKIIALIVYLVFCIAGFLSSYDQAEKNKIFEIITQIDENKRTYYTVLSDIDNYITYESQITKDNTLNIQLRNKRIFDKTEVKTKKTPFDNITIDSTMYSVEDLLNPEE